MAKQKKNETVCENQPLSVTKDISIPELKMEAPEVFLDGVQSAVEVKERDFHQVNPVIRNTITNVAKVDKNIKHLKNQELTRIASVRLRGKRLGGGRDRKIKLNIGI
jgi:hypothetical protein